MDRFTSIKAFSGNINMRGPLSGRDFEDSVEEVMDVEVLREWQESMCTQAVEITKAEMLPTLIEKIEQGEMQQDEVFSIIVTAAIERAAIAAFAAGLFTGQALPDGQGILVEPEKKSGWEGI
jgi:hypothetical protein